MPWMPSTKSYFWPCERTAALPPRNWPAWLADRVIVGYAVLLAPEHGLGAVRAHVMIKVGPKETRSVTAALRAIAQVRVLHSVSGEVDLIAVAATASVAEMDQVIDRIGALDGVERTTSSIILSTKFER
jgi:DNA-binding Lrp family transcriptional regulator